MTAKIVLCAFETTIIAIRGIQVPVNGHIIQESEDDYCGKEERQDPGGESMFGKCSTTCLQFLINFLKPSQRYSAGAHGSRAVPFH